MHTVSSASVSVARVRLGAGGRFGCGFVFGHRILLDVRRDKTDAVFWLYFSVYINIHHISIISNAHARTREKKTRFF